MMSLRPRITVLGCGYLGITHAACMAHLGFEVLGVDTDPAKVARLSTGRLPVYEPGLGNLLRAGLDCERLRFTISYTDAAAFGDVHFLCVGTPPREDESADLSQVYACVNALSPLLERPCLIAGKSTVPAGTAADLAQRIAATAPAGRNAELAWNPEFLREGSAVQDTLRPDRIVAGVASSHAEMILREVYQPLLAEGVPFYVTDLATAELAKAAANSFLAVKVSFINAMAEVCEHAGADVTVLAEILGSDPRIGQKFLRPGLGFGGGCLPKDLRAFIARADELGAGRAVRFLREVDAVNLRRRAAIADLAGEVVGGTLTGRRICVLGASFKPDTDDIRDSPALDVAKILDGLGALVTVYDPAAIDSARRTHPQLEYASSPLEAARDADVVMVATEWPEFTRLDPVLLGSIVAQRHVVDARHVLDRSQWLAAGWEYRAPGVPVAVAAERR